ncbi:kinase-like domain-containing protein [Dichomitus squalens]|uniref:Kinase-like domain-containing protein n=1 Tax=Dichomitus squalens TaxID=114155 RepID=A0A4Q9NEB2_9APHY|nr:kinase-like domain-containing protein [Dichomitus squalens]TBU51668.1 kinase-like domain-containing protein [Dichomitus squalens]
MSATPARLPRYAYVDAESAARHAKDTEDGLYRLLPGEIYWKDRYFFLDGCGYTLRPRYHPEWRPSWIGTNRDPMFCEDSITLITPGVIDATRRSDQFRVAIKSTRNDTREIHIARYLTEQHSARNHCVPVLDIRQDPLEPHMSLMVMPHLRQFYDPDFGTIDEVMDFIRQSLEGLRFLHECRVAHRDIAAANVMMDGRSLYPQGYHPVRTEFLPDGANDARPLSRSNCSVQYYYVDFGLSTLFEEGEDPLVLGRTGRDKEIPELSNEVPYDAYRADVFALGNLYYKEFISKYHGLDLIRPLVNMMKWKDPAQRPTADAAFHLFEAIYSRTDETLLRWRLRSRTESAPERVVYDTVAVAREGIYQLRRLIS